MAMIISPAKCDLCGICITACTFRAMEVENGGIVINAACKACRICVRKCPSGAIALIDEARAPANIQDWRGILVFAEQEAGALHPVVLELLGKARQLAAQVKQKVCALIAGGPGSTALAEELAIYGADQILVYEDKALADFRADCYTSILYDGIRHIRPAIVLIGATPLGRGLAPRVATRFRTGLTADCTELEINADGSLVQIRPAYGGNIMARIATPHARPQMATVRYKVMDRATAVTRPRCDIEIRPVTAAMLQSGVRILQTAAVERQVGIEDAEVLVVGGRGLRKKEDLALLARLAGCLGGQIAVSRPLVEAGWAHFTQQIGLSGRTVHPRLIMTCGVSGTIQFAAGVNAPECVVAINTDPAAPIFGIANYGLVGDLYEIVPKLIESIESEAQSHAKSL
jgi:electron transfer flavoprotein alpha subunit